MSDAPTAAEITELLAHYWNRYDDGRIAELAPYLTEEEPRLGGKPHETGPGDQ